MIQYIMAEASGLKYTMRWIAMGALFLIPCTPLIVTESFFFPFITGKAFFLRILIEIAVAAWLFLATLDKNYRPRFSWIGAACMAFVAWMFVADLFALNVTKAFWSNFERMEGWILLIHLLGFFFAASAVLRVEQKWRTWFSLSVLVSVVVSLYALLQVSGQFSIHQGSTRIDASFGNSAYLAIYLLFTIFTALWLILTENRMWLKWALGVLIALDTILLFLTETRGTIVGFIAALLCMLLMTVFRAATRTHQVAWAGLVLLLIIVGGFYLARNSAFVQTNHVLQRIASVSLSDGQTRFTIWHMALEGAAEHPVLGWGQEGFNYVFNKYYEPSLYGQESWFDRAHNAFIDWLSAGGVPAFVLYLSLFGTALLLLWRRSELSRPERVVLTAALIGYAFHNLFVFDNLYSYIYFFGILAFLDSKVGRQTALEHMPQLSPTAATIYAFPVTLILTVGIIYVINIPGITVATKLITALTSSGASIESNIQTFEDLVTQPAFAAQEIREQIVAFAAAAAQNSSVPDAEKQKIVSLAVTEMQKQVAAYPQDARERLQLAYAYRTGNDAPDALQEIKIAEMLSPNKEEILIQEGVTEWDLGDTKAAQAAFAKAYTLGAQFPSLAVYAAAGDIAVGDTASGDRILRMAYGTTTVDSDVLAVAYYRTKNWSSLIRLGNLRAQSPTASAQAWFSLAAAYYAAGDTHNAIATIRTAMMRYPDTASAGAAAIQQIQKGTVGK